LCDDKWKWKIEPFIIAADEMWQDMGRRAYTNSNNISKRRISDSKQLIHLQYCTFIQGVCVEWATCLPWSAAQSVGKYALLKSCFRLSINAARGRSWLRHCATNRQVAGSIPDGVTGIFSLT
jgi:hypothetical protein